MKAKQLMFTSFENGENANKGFMIYAKSEGISTADCDCICYHMDYTPPAGAQLLPLSLSKEESAELFPKDFAAFTLPSGNICVAQSAYVGLDYSGRPGNYFIHAYVFEAGTDLLPYKISQKSMCFKECLTEAEKQSVAPPVLESVEIFPTYLDEVSQNEASEYFARDYNAKRFAGLIQTVINRRQGKKTRVYLNGSNDFMSLTLRLAGCLLPVRIAKRLSFHTYLLSPRDGADILCIRPDTYGITYAPRMDYGVFAFDEYTKTCSGDVSPCGYAAKITALASENLSTAKALAETVDGKLGALSLDDNTEEAMFAREFIVSEKAPTDTNKPRKSLLSLLFKKQ